MSEFRITGVFLEHDGANTPFELVHVFKAEEITRQQATMAAAQRLAHGRIVAHVKWERVDAAS